MQTRMPRDEEGKPGGRPIEVQLGDLVRQIRSSTIPDDLPAETRFVGLENIAAQEGDFLELSTTSDVRSRVFEFHAQDVLYGRLRPYQRKAAVASFDGYASGEVIVMRCSDKILPGFLRTVLLSENFTRYANARAKGDRPRISFATVASYRVELPGLETQQAILERDSRMHGAVRALGEVRASVEQITGDILSQLRSRLIWASTPSNRLVPLKDMVESIDYGTSKKSTYDASGSPVLRIPNIKASGVIDSEDLKYSPLNPQELERSRVETGDILLVRSNGSPAWVGRAAKVSPDYDGYAFAGYLLRLRPKVGISSDYLLQVVQSNEFQRLVAAGSRSSTGIHNLSAGRLARFLVPTLAAEHQLRVVELLARLQASAESASANVTQAWDKAMMLHEVARGGWLSHPVPAGPEGHFGLIEAEAAAPEPVKLEGQSRQSDLRTIVLQKLDRLSGGTASFETLFTDASKDYDVERDAIFGLLAAKPPIVTQAFDPESRSIVFKRAK
ncbi:hypothetical protein IFT36_06530 [Frigoribacterium sp. CFBP 13605]|uniref:restriction endonuclease subunit S n=1 Tax=Frigoribacterium sp. CFBP 13605 TaxID=2774034 RepID=UPI001906A1D6|nr:hypothetical protein [Frigoribacterium sp. CFBP 13605]MBD8140202.1 hypothetical protein [Frigoribacterium sp. CFBP 13605]